jgi:hypothetical protein
MHQGLIRFLAVVAISIQSLSLLALSFVGWFVRNCIDVCPVNDRAATLDLTKVLGIGIGLSFLLWVMELLWQSTSRSLGKTMMAVVYPFLLLLFFIVLAASVNGSFLFPRTLNPTDPWVYAWLLWVIAIWGWPIFIVWFSAKSSELP